MTPARGTKPLDRRFRHVGRIKKASGTNDPATFALLNGMLDGLFQAGRLDILKAIRDGVVAPLVAWEFYRLGQLERIPTVESIRRLWRADAKDKEVGEVERWRLALDCSDDQRQNLRNYFAQLRKHAAADATVADLPAVVAAYREACVAADTPTIFNRARAAAQAFLRDTVGRTSHLWKAVADVKPLKVRRRRRLGALTPGEARTLCRELGPTHGAHLWSMCVTGMSPSEYWGRWEVRERRGCVHVFGPKRDQRDRDVPLVERPSVPTTQYAAFRKRLNAVSAKQRVPRDGRRAFSHWMEEARIPRTRRRMYRGHGAGDVGDLYEQAELRRYLRKDARRLRRYLGLDDTNGGGLKLVTEGE